MSNRSTESRSPERKPASMALTFKMSRAVFVLLSAIACTGCTGPSSFFQGTWGDIDVTLWLKSDRTFLSRESSRESSKPSGVIFLRGTWSDSKTALLLSVTDQVTTDRSNPPFSYGVHRNVSFVTKMELNPRTATLVLHQLHLTPIPGDTKPINSEYHHLTPAPPEVSWDDIMKHPIEAR